METENHAKRAQKLPPILTKSSQPFFVHILT